MNRSTQPTQPLPACHLTTTSTNITPSSRPGTGQSAKDTAHSISWVRVGVGRVRMDTPRNTSSSSFGGQWASLRHVGKQQVAPHSHTDQHEIWVLREAHRIPTALTGSGDIQVDSEAGDHPGLEGPRLKATRPRPAPQGLSHATLRLASPTQVGKMVPEDAPGSHWSRIHSIGGSPQCHPGQDSWTPRASDFPWACILPHELWRAPEYPQSSPGSPSPSSAPSCVAWGQLGNLSGSQLSPPCPGLAV